MRLSRGVLWSMVFLVACGEVEEAGEGEPEWWELPFAREVISFTPGEGAGFGSDKLPEVVLGPATGRGTRSGSFEVLSLGHEGEIVLGLGGRELVDGEGVDFIVYENAFWYQDDPDQVFAELGEVSVSMDGEEWFTFPCEYSPEDPPPYEGCAGWSPSLEFDASSEKSLSVEITGGDGFDLSDIGVERARYVRVRDLWGVGDTPSRGFDLDAVGLVHYEEE